jgi:hypothetical protein
VARLGAEAVRPKNIKAWNQSNVSTTPATDDSNRSITAEVTEPPPWHGSGHVAADQVSATRDSQTPAIPLRCDTVAIENATSSATSYQSSNRRTILLAIGAVAFVAASAWVLVSHPSVKAVIAGGVGVPFFGLCAVLWTSRLVRRRPELVLTDEGLTHVTSGHISWAEIDHVRVREIKVRGTSQRVIEIILRDPASYLARVSIMTRLTAAANRRFGFSPVNISAVSLPVSLETVLESMHHHHPNLAIKA